MHRLEQSNKWRTTIPYYWASPLKLAQLAARASCHVKHQARSEYKAFQRVRNRLLHYEDTAIDVPFEHLH